MVELTLFPDRTKLPFQKNISKFLKLQKQLVKMQRTSKRLALFTIYIYNLSLCQLALVLVDHINQLIVILMKSYATLARIEAICLESVKFTYRPIRVFSSQEKRITGYFTGSLTKEFKYTHRDDDNVHALFALHSRFFRADCYYYLSMYSYTISLCQYSHTQSARC